MQKIIVILFKLLKFLIRRVSSAFSYLYCSWLFYLNKIDVKSFKCFGIPYIHISMNASCSIGSNLVMNNGSKYSDSGVGGVCRIEVRDSAVLEIGDNVGMSDVTITCHEKITIGNNVLLGVGCQLRDTDNHSLNPADWLNGNDWKNKRSKPISIGDNVFIGGYSFILKGVKIGDNSIVGAGSIVTTNIPPNEIWAGNPAKFIKRVVN